MLRIYFPLFLFTMWLSSCGSFERDIEVDLPEVERQLVIESYLEVGKPYRVLLTETKGYFDPLDDCPFVKGATVIIKHNGISDTLEETGYFSNDCSFSNGFGLIPTFFNESFTRVYNYGSNTICPLDYNSDFEIEVIDPMNNRQANASARFLPPVPIDSMSATFDDAGENAFVLTKTAIDNPVEVNFYRFMLHKTSLIIIDSSSGTPIPLARNPEISASIDDARLFNGKSISLGTGYNYQEGDTLIASLYHIEQSYHDYLETQQDAISSNGNPFGQPVNIISNIRGGTGIFATLSYVRDTLIIQK